MSDFKAGCTKFDFSLPETSLGELTALLSPLAVFMRPTSEVRREMDRKGKEREGEGN